MIMKKYSIILPLLFSSLAEKKLKLTISNKLIISTLCIYITFFSHDFLKFFSSNSIYGHESCKFKCDSSPLMKKFWLVIKTFIVARLFGLIFFAIWVQIFSVTVFFDFRSTPSFKKRLHIEVDCFSELP